MNIRRYLVYLMKISCFNPESQCTPFFKFKSTDVNLLSSLVCLSDKNGIFSVIIGQIAQIGELHVKGQFWLITRNCKFISYNSNVKNDRIVSLCYAILRTFWIARCQLTIVREPRSNVRKSCNSLFLLETGFQMSVIIQRSLIADYGIFTDMSTVQALLALERHIEK